MKQTVELAALTSSNTSESVTKYLLGGHCPLIAGITFSGALGGATGVRLLGDIRGGSDQEVIAEVTDLTSEMQYDSQNDGRYEKLTLALTGTADGSTSVIPYVEAV